MDDVLFMGWMTDQGVGHYRAKVPAMALDADWAIYHDGKVIQGQARKGSHDIIIFNNSFGELQLRMVDKAKKRSGAILVANVDDWIKTIAKMGSEHGFSEFFAKRSTQENFLRFLDMTDAAIVSTPFLAEKLKGFYDKKDIHLCRNMIDTWRYDMWPEPERDAGTIIGWAGGTGHRGALRPLTEPIASVLRGHAKTRFVMVGDDVRGFFPHDVRSRLHSMQWSEMETYPKHMKMFDLSLAPGKDNDFYRAKSQLRLYETAVLGIPVVAHPMYDEMQHGVHGFHAREPKEWFEYIDTLVRDDALRLEMGKNIKELSKEFTVEARKGEWEDAISKIRLLR